MLISRRIALLGLGATSLLPAFPAFASTDGSAERRFDIIRGEDPIGSETLRVTRTGSEMQVAVDVEIKVKIIGLTAYSYTMRNREVWRDGLLESMEAKTTEDGKEDFARVRREGDGLVIEGSEYSGAAPSDAVTTTYWAPAYLRRRVWISSQTGAPLSVGVAPAGKVEVPVPGGAIQADVWRVSGDLNIDLFFQGEEWVGNRFEAKGEMVQFVAAATTPPLGPLAPA